MRRFEHELVDDDVGVELFDDLPAQRGRVRLVRAHLAAGKLPVAGEVNAVLSACHEEPIVMFDYRGNDIHPSGSPAEAGHYNSR